MDHGARPRAAASRMSSRRGCAPCKHGSARRTVDAPDARECPGRRRLRGREGDGAGVVGHLGWPWRSARLDCLARTREEGHRHPYALESRCAVSRATPTCPPCRGRTSKFPVVRRIVVVRSTGPTQPLPEKADARPLPRWIRVPSGTPAHHTEQCPTRHEFGSWEEPVDPGDSPRRVLRSQPVAEG